MGGTLSNCLEVSLGHKETGFTAGKEGNRVCAIPKWLHGLSEQQLSHQISCEVSQVSHISHHQRIVGTRATVLEDVSWLSLPTAGKQGPQVGPCVYSRGLDSYESPGSLLTPLPEASHLPVTPWTHCLCYLKLTSTPKGTLSPWGQPPAVAAYPATLNSPPSSHRGACEHPNACTRALASNSLRVDFMFM